MNIDRSPSARNDNASRDVDRARDKPREQPKAEDVDRFRGLMQNAQAGGQKGLGQELRLRGEDPSQALFLCGEQQNTQTTIDQAVQAKSWGEGDQSGDQDSSSAENNPASETLLRPAELAALYQAQVATRDVPATLPPAAPQAHTNPQALADMLERHVRQLAASPTGADQDKAQILLRLNDATLPGTDLLLSRTENGWLLRADVRSRASFDAIQQAAPRLAERFASRSLGALEVEPHYHS